MSRSRFAPPGHVSERRKPQPNISPKAASDRPVGSRDSRTAEAPDSPEDTPDSGA